MALRNLLTYKNSIMLRASHPWHRMVVNHCSLCGSASINTKKT